MQVEHLLGELCVNLRVLCVKPTFNAEVAEKDAEIAEIDSDNSRYFKAPRKLIDWDLQTS